MKRILVPTDFSAQSENAYEYALHLAKKLGAGIKALHVSTEDQLTREKIVLLEQRLRKFAKLYPNQMAAPIRHQTLCSVKNGRVVPTIIEESDEVDLIVIGTRSKHNATDYITGTVCTELIKYSDCPILIVPQGCYYKPMKEMAFATSIELKDDKALLSFEQFADQLGAKASQVYIYPLPSDFSNNKEEVINTNYIDGNPSFYSTVNVVRDISVERGLDYYIKKHQVDLLGMFVPQRTRLQFLFHPSLTKRMVLKAPLPLLIYRA